MNIVTRQVLECIADEVLQIARSVFDEKGFRDSSIREKVEVELQTEPNPVIHILFEHYLDFIEKGRIPGSGQMPPISELRDWALRKGLPVTNGMLYAIANVIVRDGAETCPILSVIETRLDSAFGERWADELFETIIADLSAFFE